MKHLLRLRPSPAMVIACIALMVALGGTSYAAIKLPRNSVGAKQLKKNAVTGPKVKANTIKGADVLESSLAEVPSAATAATATTATTATNATNAANAANATNAAAVTGNKVRSFSQLGTGPIPNAQILDLNGLQLYASCSAIGEVTLTAKTTLNDSEISAVSFDMSDASDQSLRNYDDSLLTTETFTVPQLSFSDEIGSLRFSGAGGKFVDLTYNQEDDLGSTLCVLHGFAISN
jgi:hypothetical protein